MDITAHKKLHFQLYLENPRYHHTEIWSDIGAASGKPSLLVFPLLWRQKTSSTPFYDFDKLTIWCDLFIFIDVYYF